MAAPGERGTAGFGELDKEAGAGGDVGGDCAERVRDGFLGGFGRGKIEVAGGAGEGEAGTVAEAGEGIGGGAVLIAAMTNDE